MKEDDDNLILDGLDETQIAKYKKDFFNGMHSKQNVNIALLTEDDVHDVEFNGVHFLFFYIPRVDRSLRPVYRGLDPYTGTYRRDLDGDYHCSREEVNSMFADANLASPVDRRILKNFSKDDLDPASIQQYRRRFEQWNPDHVWNKLPEDQFLEKLNVFRKDSLPSANVALPEANVTLNMDTSGANVALSDPNVALPSANMALNMDTSESNVTLPSANVTLECYTSESNVTLPKRYTKVQLKEKVLSICSDWVTAEQIAAQLGRDVRYIKSYVLPQMADILEKMYDVPHHPRQKYRVKIE